MRRSKTKREERESEEEEESAVRLTAQGIGKVPEKAHSGRIVRVGRTL